MALPFSSSASQRSRHHETETWTMQTSLLAGRYAQVVVDDALMHLRRLAPPDQTR